MKKVIPAVLMAILLAVSAAAAGGKKTMTLSRCIAYGLVNSPILDASRRKVEGAEQDVKMARADFMPSLSSSAGVTRITSISASGLENDDYIDQNSRNYAVRLSQILYAGSRIMDTYHRTKAQKEMTAAELSFARLQTIYTIETSFFDLMKAKEDVQAAEDMLKRLTAGLEAAKAYYKMELAPYVDVLQARVDLDDAALQLSQARNQVKRKRAALMFQINMPDTRDVSFTGGLDYFSPGLNLTPASCWHLARAHRPDLKIYEKQKEAAVKSAVIAKNKYLPVIRLDVGYIDQDNDYQDPGVSGTYQYDKDQQNRYWSAGVSASWNMFDGGRAWFERKKYISEEKRITALIKDTENSIKKEIQTIFLNLTESETRIRNARSAVQTATEYYQREQKRFKARIATIPSLLDAQARLTRAEGNHNQALLDYQVARAGIKYMVGKETMTNQDTQ